MGVLLSIANALGLSELELDAELGDAAPDAEAEGADEASEGEGGGAGHRLLELLGVGRVPLMLLLIALLIGFGVTGLIALRGFSSVLPAALAGPLALALAAPTALVCTSRLAALIARLVPSIESYADQRVALIGHSGRVTLTLPAAAPEARDGVAQGFGRVTVVDAQGTRYEVRARAGTQPLPPGTQVLLTDFDAEQHVFTAEPFSL
jgi:hypothetical protein